MRPDGIPIEYIMDFDQDSMTWYTSNRTMNGTVLHVKIKTISGIPPWSAKKRDHNLTILAFINMEENFLKKDSKRLGNSSAIYSAEQ